jgi:tetratricopeptide (TPR) repeat protein
VQGDTGKHQAVEQPVKAAPIRKIWGFRLASMLLLPLLAVLCIEIGLRLAGYGYPTSFFLRSKIGDRKTLIPNEKFGWRFFGPDLARTPRPMEIPFLKRPRTCRIFVFGESAAYGDPKPEFGLPRFLQILLADRFPGIHFEVINAAMTGINSHVILPIAHDCAREHGDVWVIYMGNNEVVGPFGRGTVFGRQAPSLGVIRASIALKATRIGQLLSQILAHIRPGPAQDPEWRGMAMFVNNQIRHDDPGMPIVYSHFERNLKDIIHLAQSQGAGVIVSTVLVNLKDCAPFGSQHRLGLTAPERSQWEHFFDAGVQAENSGNTTAALKQYEAAAQLDEQYAELQFRWARCCLALGLDDKARDHFALSRDYDTLRFRTDGRLNELIRTTAGGRGPQQRIQMIDSAAELAKASPHGIPGAEFLYEHVHLNFEGNYRLALGLAARVVDVLPQNLKELASASAKSTWLSEEECAKRLASTAWDRARTLRSVLLRLNQPPFTSQCNQPENYRRACEQLEQLLAEQRPAGLRKCAEQYREAVALAPQDWVLRHNQAELLRSIGDISEAEAGLRKAVELLPHDSLGHLALGLLLVQSHRPQEAIGQFDEVLQVNPKSVAALDAYALALNELGRRDEAIDRLKTALQFAPHSVDTRLNLAMVLEAAGRKQEADEHLQRALAENLETPETLVRAGRACMVRGWVDQAITNFSRAVLLNPTDAKVQSYLGGALETKGRFTQSQEHFAQAVRLDPELSTAHLGLGVDLSRQGKDSEALEEFSAALKLDPNLIDARLRLGVCLMRQRKLDDARRQFEQVLTIQPTNSAAQQYLMMIDKAANPHL